jgi:hypothetical protein
VRLFENMGDLCRGVGGADTEASGDAECRSLHIPTGPEIARAIAFPWLAFAYGWSF